MPVPARFFRTTGELRNWFEHHHTDTLELWVGFHKAHTGRPGVVYAQALDEALCFGWIDTTVRRLDADRYAQRFTPRRPDSYWSTVNCRRFAELDRLGRVHPVGRRAFERRSKKGRPQYSSASNYRLAPTFASRLRGTPTADRFFRSRNRGYRKRATFWVMSAARPDTRERRFTALLHASAAATIPPALLLPGEVAPRPTRPPAGDDKRVRANGPRHRQSVAGRR